MDFRDYLDIYNKNPKLPDVSVVNCLCPLSEECKCPQINSETCALCYKLGEPCSNLPELLPLPKRLYFPPKVSSPEACKPHRPLRIKSGKVPVSEQYKDLLEIATEDDKAKQLAKREQKEAQLAKAYERMIRNIIL